MSEIPEDVRIAADEVADRLFRTGKHLHDPIPLNPRAIIAEAILAERKRCERIADKWVGGNFDGCAESIRDDIADGIRP